MSKSRGLSFPVILIAGIILAAAFLSTVLLVRYISHKYSPSISNAEKYLNKGRLNEAFALTEKVDNDSPRLLILKGRIFLALSLRKQRGDNWKKYGVDSTDWLKGEEIENALRCFKDAITLDPLSADAHYYLGYVYKEKGWYSEAKSEYNSALEINPGRIDVRVGLSSLFTRMDHIAEAQEVLRDAYKMAPDDPTVAKNMAFLFRYYIDTPESAMVWFNRYLNNVTDRDFDVNIAKKEFQDLTERYPEYIPSEPQDWRDKTPHFVPRKR